MSYVAPHRGSLMSFMFAKMSTPDNVMRMSRATAPGANVSGQFSTSYGTPPVMTYLRLSNSAFESLCILHVYTVMPSAGTSCNRSVGAAPPPSYSIHTSVSLANSHHPFCHPACGLRHCGNTGFVACVFPWGRRRGRGHHCHRHHRRVGRRHRPVPVCCLSAA